MKKLPLLLLFAVLFAGCDSLFDEGDLKKTYDGPDVVAFYPLQLQTRVVNNQAVIQVQLIGPQRSSDLSVRFNVDGASTAVAGTHYNLVTASPVTIPANSSTANIVVQFVPGSVPSGEVRLLLNLDGADGVAAAENLKRSTIFIRP
jgi:hypothetical protein